ncbi:uncharacterized protein LOC135338099 [Halichondria panicea]|uniref:uncharacterized protein LOC135338099 n=1 Tax=Halichondria panicea TaxID=6063 RepID=UPI00312BC882
MMNEYIGLHDPDSLKKYRHFGPVSGTISLLLRVLKEQLLNHHYADALKSLEGLLVRCDNVPDMARRLCLEVVLHDAGLYGDTLVLFKRFFLKRLKYREETLLDLCIYIAQSGNVQEAYETLQSQISAEPYNSNPLLRGYSGVFQYLLWEKEVASEKQLRSKKEEAASSECSGSSDEESTPPSESLLIRAFSRQALAHFDTLWSMSFSQQDNMDYFIEVHHKLLVALGEKKKAFEVLQNCDEKFPRRIPIKRLLCKHLREMSPAKVRRRRHYLKALVELDESCQEVIELVEMLLEKDRVDSTLCHHLLLFHLDYPSNGHHPKAWKLLEDVHTSQAELLQSEAWQSRLQLWRELYPDKIKH